MSIQISDEQAALFTKPLSEVFSADIVFGVEVVADDGKMPEHTALTADRLEDGKKVGISEPFDIGEMTKTTLSATEELKLRRANKPIPPNALILQRKGAKFIEAFANTLLFELLAPRIPLPQKKSDAPAAPAAPAAEAPAQK